MFSFRYNELSPPTPPNLRFAAQLAVRKCLHCALYLLPCSFTFYQPAKKVSKVGKVWEATENTTVLRSIPWSGYTQEVQKVGSGERTQPGRCSRACTSACCRSRVPRVRRPTDLVVSRSCSGSRSGRNQRVLTASRSYAGPAERDLPVRIMTKCQYSGVKLGFMSWGAPVNAP